MVEETMNHESHVSRLAVRPNANTRMAAPGPRLEAGWLDEAYARARALQVPPMTAPGYRLVWWRGREIGWHDLVAHPAAYAVVGRHTQCDVVLPTDPGVALRHVLVRSTTLADGAVAVRLLDLHTQHGFHLDEDAERRALAAVGPLAVRIGRYVIVALPSGAVLPETRPRSVIVDAPRLPSTACPEGERSPWGPPARSGSDSGSGAGRLARITHVTTLPPAPLLEELPYRAPMGGFARVTLRNGAATATVDLPPSALDAGVLVGRADKCETQLRPALTASISRVHVLLLREQGVVHAFDVASTQGMYCAEGRIRRVELGDERMLHLATKDPVMLYWQARATLA
jgi:hypothetical protein